MGLKAATQYFSDKEFLLKGDSLTVIHWITHLVSCEIADLPIFKDLIALKSRLPACSIFHISREQNEVADWLSKYALIGAFCLTLDDIIPCALVQILQNDMFYNAHFIL